jgi:hypothetical protein
MVSLEATEQKNAPELPSDCFINDTHRRQPGDFVRSSYLTNTVSLITFTS